VANDCVNPTWPRGDGLKWLHLEHEEAARGQHRSPRAPPCDLRDRDVYLSSTIIAATTANE